ncbi:protein FAR-RED ELONGATED HYPOCOTYL 3-like [Chenopodium quinoa]|uniref:protein FAR-RED ELONGATED HYPOCOTYL 3-like n=1 Tax=Chenopodium quinoa TaxID=63459 RepID=UPI000B7931B1|nr:protein FAR-RED ELONGATED HYPOCOTYL 3-like [Chenopodium quinoa]
MTQRVESTNSFFDGFVNQKTKLFEFPRQYTRAMMKHVKDEVDVDDNCSKYLRRLMSGFKLEKVVQRLYTDTKFQEDRVWIVPLGHSHEEITDRRRFYRVTFDTITKEECDCRKFETFGIMCKHSMRILDQNLVFEIPEKYILTQWHKDVMPRHTRVKVPYHDPSLSVTIKRCNKMLNAFEPFSEVASTADDAAIQVVLQGIAKLKAQVQKLKQKKDELNPLPEVVAFPSGPGPSQPKSVDVVVTMSSVHNLVNDEVMYYDDPAVGEGDGDGGGVSTCWMLMNNQQLISQLMMMQTNLEI